MKKCILVLVILAIMATGAFAQGFSLSIGGGTVFDWSGNNGINVNVPILGEGYGGFRNTSIGGFVFFDATYAELDMSFSYGHLSFMTEGLLSAMGSYMTFLSLPKGDTLQFAFSLLGKYPFRLGSITLFPLIGFDYNIVTSALDGDIDLSQFGFLGGLGLDFNLNDHLFLRGEAMFHLRLASKAMKDFEDIIPILSEGIPLDTKTTLGVGPRIKLGIGYRF